MASIKSNSFIPSVLHRAVSALSTYCVPDQPDAMVRRAPTETSNKSVSLHLPRANDVSHTSYTATLQSLLQGMVSTRGAVKACLTALALGNVGRADASPWLCPILCQPFTALETNVPYVLMSGGKDSCSNGGLGGLFDIFTPQHPIALDGPEFAERSCTPILANATEIGSNSNPFGPHDYTLFRAHTGDLTPVELTVERSINDDLWYYVYKENVKNVIGLGTGLGLGLPFGIVGLFVGIGSIFWCIDKCAERAERRREAQQEAANGAANANPPNAFALLVDPRN